MSPRSPFTAPKNASSQWFIAYREAIAHFGIGAVFLGLLIPVYRDLQNTHLRTAKQQADTVEILSVVASKLDRLSDRMATQEMAIRHLETMKNQ